MSFRWIDWSLHAHYPIGCDGTIQLDCSIRIYLPNRIIQLLKHFVSILFASAGQFGRVGSNMWRCSCFLVFFRRNRSEIPDSSLCSFWRGNMVFQFRWRRQVTVWNLASTDLLSHKPEFYPISWLLIGNDCSIRCTSDSIQENGPISWKCQGSPKKAWKPSTTRKLSTMTTSRTIIVII